MSTRRFWQIHLSTAVVLMFVAGALIWKNVVPRHVAWYDPIIHSHQHQQQKFHDDMLAGKYWIHGWPMVVSRQPVNSADGLMDEPSRWVTVTANTIAGVFILFASATVIEALLRSRESRR